jgi:predicted flap endonuclease-1-like 5' DNA nuclease
MTTQANQPQQNELPRGIGRPATNALNLAGYFRLEQLAGVREADLLKLHGVGPKAIRVLKEALKDKGLAFADKK